MKRFLPAVPAIAIIPALVVLALATCTAGPGPASTEPGVLARVALLSDAHMNRATNGEQAGYAPHFAKAIAQVNAAGVDFALVAGDLAQSGKPEELADFKEAIKQLRPPVWFVPGNHDIGEKVLPGKTGHVTPARIEAFEKILGPTWFATNCAGVRIIGANSSLLGSGLDREAEMWKFLEGELKTPVTMPTVLFMHYPLFVKDVAEPGGEYWNVEPAPRARMLSLLKQGGVKIVLSGHLHRPLTNTAEGIRFVGTPPTSFGLPAGKQPEGWTLITISKSGEVTDAFQKLE